MINGRRREVGGDNLCYNVELKLFKVMGKHGKEIYLIIVDIHSFTKVS